MIVVIIVFLVVVRRRQRLASSRNRQGRRSRHLPSRADPSAPDYDAPYVIYGPPGANGEHQLTMGGLFVQPPPYVEEPPPAFDETSDVTRSAADNPGFDAQDTSATDKHTSSTAA